MKKHSYFLFLALLLFPFQLLAADTSTSTLLDLTGHWVGFLAIAIFVLAYSLVIFEEKIHLRKSKPILVAAGLIWLVIGIVYHQHGMSQLAEEAVRHNFLEYAELFFFLLVAMTYINAMIERDVFDALRDWLVNKGFSYKQLFWMTGILAFFISPIADNLTTALIMCSVVLAVGNGHAKFIGLSCINIVVAANAGGAFSPFGDITTLMVWQKGMVEFSEFFALFIPSLVNFLVPAIIMQFAIMNGKPKPIEEGSHAQIKQGGLIIVGLFLLTIITAVSFHNFLHLPPAIGMMLGLGFLKFYGFFLRKQHKKETEENPTSVSTKRPYDIFDRIAQAEWDTLFFFYGVILAVGGLGFLGYLGMASSYMYGELGATPANILVGILSSIVDNIPVMFAVLTMQPDMSHAQWLLVTLTAGVGGSLLSVGSAAGIALMGQARGHYTFMTHLKWTPVIALGYAASIWVHTLINGF
ncbi:sodium:proton antiporter NhaD [Kangiella aquimarina]|uniref:Sodium:proton antiporter NhaD n=1 Tax=Kangiella aquimarina TaxID=261965 RepID=A0ABZ0X1D3_9GAMM|nr:sodium:proton antiporter NhaD [Kangiella aquimarina]WQG84397.1 sodium:proton antiporter NhaD [Kangiella aquimarina]